MTEDPSSSIHSIQSSQAFLGKFLLSIVTINRNNAGNLEKTLQSLRQIPENAGVEFIFIDGASTDDVVLSGKVAVDCDKISGRTGLPWKREI